MSNEYGPSDERRREAYRNRPESRSSGSLWMFFGSIGCIVLLGCAGVFVAVALWASKVFKTDIPAATTAANEFLDLIQENRIDEAYAKTSPEFKAAQSREQFATFIKRYETFAKSTSRALNGARIFQGTKKQAFVQMTLQSPECSGPQFLDHGRS